MSLNRFPKLEFSYDKNLHKKVSAEFYTLVPRGERAWLWFTYTGGKNACFIVRGKEVTLYTACFADALSLGTILSGTVFNHAGRTHFAAHDMVHYEGYDVTDRPFEKRLTLMATMFQTQLKKSPLCQKLIIGVPVMTTSFNEAQRQSETVPYPVYGIRHLTKDGNSKGILPIRVKVSREGVFQVQADLKSDVYHLHFMGDRGNPLTAAVPSYKRSVALNSIFRDIKENRNLDALEESDDEAEFEDVREEKHVNLKKMVPMRCIFHKRFQKWEPVEIVKGHRVKLMTAAELS